MRRLSGALGNLDDGMFGSFDRLIGGDASTLRQRGGGLLKSLLGDNVTGNIATAISRFTGIAPETVRSLLAYLAPVVIGRVASQWQNQGGTPTVLKTLFADQKRYIEDSLPAGFSLSDISGLNRIGDTGRAATQTAKHAEATTRSLAATLLPLVLLAAGAFLIWSLWSRRPTPQQAKADPALAQPETVVALKPVVPEAEPVDAAVPELVTAPEVGPVQRQLTDLFDSLGKAFGEIKDAASADAATPQLEKMLPQIDQLSAAWQRLPMAARTSLATPLKASFTKLKEQAGDILMLPGIADNVKTLINQILEKLVALQTGAQVASTTAP
jgi:hypothetical protein